MTAILFVVLIIALIAGIILSKKGHADMGIVMATNSIVLIVIALAVLPKYHYSCTRWLKNYERTRQTYNISRETMSSCEHMMMQLKIIKLNEKLRKYQSLNSSIYDWYIPDAVNGIPTIEFQKQGGLR